MMCICYLLRSQIDVNTWIELFIVAGISTIIALIINVHIVFNRKERKEVIMMIRQRVSN